MGNQQKPTKAILFIIPGIVIACVVLALAASKSGHFTLNLPVEHKTAFEATNLADYPARLHAEGNLIVNPSGESVRLRGIMFPDPSILQEQNRFKPRLITDIADLGANVIRVPVHPQYFVKDGEYLWRYLDPVVKWAGEAGIYVVIDWHFIGNVATGAGEQMPALEMDAKQLTLDFWKSTARYFKDTPNVIFEIFNEPQSIDAATWHDNAEEIIQVIRAQGANQLVIVGGIDFGRDLSWVIENPVIDGNIAYASHIYPIHATSGYDGWFGSTAAKYPVLMTEWGYIESTDDASINYLVGTAAGYGKEFTNYLDAHQIGWIACWYDDVWMPIMFEEGNKVLTDYGQFVVDQLSIR